MEKPVSFLGIHKWEPDIYIGLSPALHLQCTVFLTHYAFAAGPGAGAQGPPMDHVHHPREAGQGLRSLHPGRVRPLQGHDQHRLQLSPARADRRQLGSGEFVSFFSTAML